MGGPIGDRGPRAREKGRIEVAAFPLCPQPSRREAMAKEMEKNACGEAINLSFANHKILR